MEDEFNSEREGRKFRQGRERCRRELKRVSRSRRSSDLLQGCNCGDQLCNIATMTMIGHDVG